MICGVRDAHHSSSRNALNQVVDLGCVEKERNASQRGRAQWRHAPLGPSFRIMVVLVVVVIMMVIMVVIMVIVNMVWIGRHENAR